MGPWGPATLPRKHPEVAPELDQGPRHRLQGAGRLDRQVAEDDGEGPETRRQQGQPALTRSALPPSRRLPRER